MPKSYGRNERIAASLRREAAHIISSEIKDPRVSLATVTEVNVSPDLRNATIYVSFLSDDEQKVSEAVQVLNKANGFVRSRLAARLKMRYMPAIHFEFDSLITKSMHLDALIAKGLGDNRGEGLAPVFAVQDSNDARTHDASAASAASAAYDSSAAADSSSSD